MQNFKFFFGLLVIALIMASCAKENIEETIDTVELAETTIVSSMTQLEALEAKMMEGKEEIVIQITDELAEEITGRRIKADYARSSCVSLVTGNDIEIGRTDATVYSFTATTADWNTVTYRLYSGSWIYANKSYDTYPAVELLNLVPDCSYEYKTRALCPPCCGSPYHSLKIGSSQFFTTHP